MQCFDIIRAHLPNVQLGIVFAETYTVGMSQDTFRYKLELEGETTIHWPEDPGQVFLLLHGYAQTGEFMYRRFSKILPADAVVVAPNGPLPIPVKKQNRWDLGFAWYLWDHYQDRYYIEEDTALDYVEQIFQAFAVPAHLPLTVIGYSQGGYLAPHVGLLFAGTKRVLGINCRFRQEKFTDVDFGFPLDAIHGENDSVVEPDRSHSNFENLRTNGQFHLVPGADHLLGDKLINKVAELL